MLKWTTSQNALTQFFIALLWPFSQKKIKKAVHLKTETHRKTTILFPWELCFNFGHPYMRVLEGTVMDNGQIIEGAEFLENREFCKNVLSAPKAMRNYTLLSIFSPTLRGKFQFFSIWRIIEGAVAPLQNLYWGGSWASTPNVRRGGRN